MGVVHMEDERGGAYIYGAVAGDEPNAVLTARNILNDGGSAADAAVGLYFVLSVTMPSAASLGGGGICLVHDPTTGTTEALDFLAPAAAATGRRVEHSTAVPGNPRGMAFLHARYGRLPWPQLLYPAEQLAREGFPVTERLSGALRRAGPELFADRQAQRIFGHRNGQPLEQGDVLRQFDLAAVLAQLRARGAGELYAGILSERFVQAVAAAGGALGEKELRAYVPQWRPTVSAAIGADRLHVAPPPAAGGIVTGEIWQMLVAGDRYAGASPDERPHLLAEAAKRAFADRARWLQPDGTSRVAPDSLLSPKHTAELMRDYQPNRATPAQQLFTAPPRQETSGGTGFVVVDGQGQAVACNVTMYAPFGTGRVAPGTGILLAPAPDPINKTLPLGPAMVVGPDPKTFKYAAAASAGETAPTAMAIVAAHSLLDRLPIAEALRQPRVHHGGLPDTTFVEPELGAERIDALVRRGHALSQAAALGQVNAVHCPSGIPNELRNLDCVAATDSRGSGLSLSAGQ